MNFEITEVKLHPATPREYGRKPRVYCWPEGETIMENLMGGRFSRPYQELRAKLLPQLFERIGLPPETKAAWSQKAGCSCSCSPGFILSDLRAGGEMPADIHVTFKAAA